MYLKLREDLYLYFYLYLCLCVSVVFLADSVHSAGGLWVDSSKWNCLICKYLYLLVYLYLCKFVFFCTCVSVVFLAESVHRGLIHIGIVGGSNICI